MSSIKIKNQTTSTEYDVLLSDTIRSGTIEPLNPVVGDLFVDTTVTAPEYVSSVNGAIGDVTVEPSLTTATANSLPLDSDELISTRAVTGTLRTLWSDCKAFLKTYFDGLYAPKLAQGKASVVLAQSAVASSVTNTLTDTQLASFTLPASILGLNGAIRITPIFTFTNSANNKILKVKLGVSQAWSNTSANTTFARTQVTITNRNNASSQLIGANNISPFININSGLTSTTENTGNALAVTIWGQCSALAETITLEGYTIELLSGAN
jgi:hypothetical protein